MPTAIKGCYSCDIKVTEVCEAIYHEQCPPCAKLAVENGNKLKAEILLLAKSIRICIKERKYQYAINRIDDILAKL